ncbi:MAG TPA: hypothetical protein VK524_12195, partial [Polyangiaceae bacterium]|nr:hypothetical protein [Polyangiaceae bacterium]
MKGQHEMAWTREPHSVSKLLSKLATHSANQAVLALVALVALACLCSCGLSHSESNSNTSWLRQCDANAQCGSGLECVCGRCTRACNTAEQCGDDLPGASCKPTSEQPAAASCHGTAEQSAQTCALGCRSNDDCAEVGGALVCRSGYCTANEARGIDGGPVSIGQPDATPGGPDPIGGDRGLGNDAGPTRDAAVGSDAGANECPNGMVVVTASDCLQDDAFCIELPDGRWCTGVSASECPAGAVPIAPDVPCPGGSNCWNVGFALRCQTPALMTIQQCTDVRGRPVLDPGDGRLFRSGCPMGRTVIGMFEGGEGGLCCALEAEDCNADSVTYQSIVCDTVFLYHWAGDSCAAYMGCCTGEDCDKATTSEADCEQQHAGCKVMAKPCGGFAGDTCSNDEYCAYYAD